jgi:PAS domain-containing protein
MESNIKQAENEVFRREEEAFFHRQDEIELSQLVKRQEEEVKRVEEAYQAALDERKLRKQTKRMQKTMQKEAKNRDTKIQQQDKTKFMAIELQETLAQHRKRFENHLYHLESKHERERAQLEGAQIRKSRDQKSLLELEIKGLRDDLKQDILKDFTYKTNLQLVLNKITSEQLLEIQQTELKQLKEHFDAESKTLEEIGYLRSQHQRITFEVEARQKGEHQKETCRIEDAREVIKVMQLNSMHSAEAKKLKVQHKMQVKMAARSQKLRASVNLKKWKELLGLDTDAGPSSSAGSSKANSTFNILGFHSATGSNAESNSSSITSLDQSDSESVRSGNSSKVTATEDELQEQKDLEQSLQKTLVEETSKAEEQLKSYVNQLNKLVERQKDELRRLRLEQNNELRFLEEKLKKQLDELELSQETEMRSLKKNHEQALSETKAMQTREYEMDANIRASERKMLTERRTLNSILDAVLDSIINITPEGTITRFNAAAEKMFGYSAEEVIVR